MKMHPAVALIVAVLIMVIALHTQPARADDQGVAYSKCIANLATLTDPKFTDRNCVHVVLPPPAGGYYEGRYKYSGGTYIVDPRFPYDGKCDARPEQTGWKGGGDAGTVAVCNQGCTYTSSLDPSSPSGFTYWPSGATCKKGDQPEPTPYTPGGGDTGGGGGSETGGGNNGGGNNGGGNSGGGNSGGGNSGGGNGGGGNGGEGDGDGGGTGGGGNGGGGNGGGTGPGQGDGDGDGPGVPSPTEGSLYTKKTKTMESVFKDFRDRVMDTEIAGGIKDFMTVPGGGSCPVFTLGASRYWNAMSFDMHCSGTFLAFLRACGYVILAIAAYAAVRIALT